MSDLNHVRRQLLFRGAILIFLMILGGAFPAGQLRAADQELPASDVAQTIRMRLESGGRPVMLRLGDQSILARNILPDFYLARFFEPAWSTEFRLQPAAFEFLDYLRGLGGEGLNPQHYHFAILEQYREEMLPGQPNVELLADFDLLMTDAFLVLASHLQNGRINPETIDPEWFAKRADFDPVPILRHGLASRQIEQALVQQLPLAPEYAGLRQALQKYRHIAEEGGWPELPSGLRLRPGDMDPAVADLRRRLTMVGDSADLRDIDEPEQYDALLVEAVQRFQRRHGLTPDGVVGKNTLAAMNVPATERVQQIEVNLERWRWLPRDLGERFLLVNIAGFELVLVEGGLPVMDMRVVVGKPYRRTPVFSGVMTYLVLNPYWNVPMRIAREDLLPQIRKDPGFPTKMGYKIFQGWGAEAREISPETVDWARISPKAFPYHLRQDPGPVNALGRVKFMFPNKYDVYLHDTPTRELFQKESRTFSSGCIRLEKPLDLALQLLAGSRFGSKDQLDNALLKERSLSVKLPKPIPVHLLYWSAWVDDENTLHLRPDIYGRDRLLQDALAEEPP